MMRPVRKFPADPLFRLGYASMRSASQASAVEAMKAGRPQTDVQLAAFLGVTRMAVQSWRRRGVPWWHADRICVEVLATHPLLVWPDFYDDIDTSEVAA